MAAHQRKVELQSAADLTYLYANTVALSRKKLDLYFPPSATNDETPDPMRERVRELVDDVSRTNSESEIRQEKFRDLSFYSAPPTHREEGDHTQNQKWIRQRGKPADKSYLSLVHKPHLHNSLVLD